MKIKREKRERKEREKERTRSGIELVRFEPCFQTEREMSISG